MPVFIFFDLSAAQIGVTIAPAELQISDVVDTQAASVEDMTEPTWAAAREPTKGTNRFIVFHEEIFNVSQTVNILFADDHSVVRGGLKTLLERQSHFKVVAEAKTGEEPSKRRKNVTRMLPFWTFGCQVCPHRSGLIIKLGRRSRLFSDRLWTRSLLFEPIQAGAAGYVLKLVGSNELVHAVECVSNGEDFKSSMIATAFNEIHNGIDSNMRLSFHPHLPRTGGAGSGGYRHDEPPDWGQAVSR